MSSSSYNSSDATNSCLWTEYKTPKTMVAEEDRENSLRLVNSSVRVCPECDKELKSGKALGGHRRSHMEDRLKEKTVKKAAEERKLNAGNSIRVSERVSRSPSNRILPSVNYLESNWRAIFQVAECEKSSELDDQSENSVNSVIMKPVMNLMDSLRGWGATGKRGKQSDGLVVGASHTISEAKTDEEAEEEGEPEEEHSLDENIQKAVEGLLLLAQERSRDFSSMIKKRQVEVSSEVSSIQIQKTEGKRPSEVDDSSKIVRGNIDKGKAKVLLKSIFASEDCKSYDSEETVEDYKTVQRPKNLNKKRKFEDLEDISSFGEVIQTQRRYSCNICSKSFANPQALGGHKSSHNKPQKTKQERREESVFGEHKCNICNEMFPSGMALGGHKRCHWTAVALVETPASSGQGNESPKEVTQPARTLLHFDLNAPPPEEEDDDVQVVPPLKTCAAA